MRSKIMRHFENRHNLAKVFPGFLQHFLTWLTGQALPGDRPFRRCTPMTALGATTCAILTGLAGSLFFASAWLQEHSAARFFGLGLSWLVLTGGARRAQVELNHFAVHNRLFETKALNKAFVAFTSIVLMIQNHDEYHRDHQRVHHGGSGFCSADDPDWVFMNELGLRAGMRVDQCWIWLLTTVLSPRFHYIFLRARLVSAARGNRWLFGCWITGISCLAWISGLSLVSLAMVVPMTVLYHVSALLQFSTEHLWNAPFIGGESIRDRQVRLSHARYPLARLPMREYCASDTEFFVRRAFWFAVQLPLGLMVRMFCLVGGMPVHNEHHGNAANPEWAMDIYHASTTEPMEKFRSYHGIIDMLNAVFAHIAHLPRDYEARRAKEGPDQ
jgi:hypothetical protein